MYEWLISKYVQFSLWYGRPREYTNGDLFETAVLTAGLLYCVGKLHGIF